MVKPVMSGWLTKEGARVKNWKRRYFTLDTRHMLRYFKAEVSTLLLEHLQLLCFCFCLLALAVVLLLWYGFCLLEPLLTLRLPLLGAADGPKASREHRHDPV